MHDSDILLLKIGIPDKNNLFATLGIPELHPRDILYERYTQDIPEIYLRSTWDIPEIYPKYPQDMPKI